jgi:heptosyltransferase-2
MATPTIEALLEIYPNAKVTIVGSYLSTQALQSHPKVVDSYILTKKLFKLKAETKVLGSFDIAISFRSSFRSSLFLMMIDAKEKYQFPKSYSGMHQVEKYALFMEESLDISIIPKNLKLHEEPYIYAKPTLGINPGATYGSAKRWYPEEFAKVAIAVAHRYNIVIFGGPGEEEIASDIESFILKEDISNVVNLAGRLDIPQLISHIAGLSWLITNDSGPMHIAAAYGIPTVALFGPTRHKETYQWKNPQGHIIRKEMDCSPCMKRVCPLGHHDCMREIKASQVVDIILD